MPISEIALIRLRTAAKRSKSSFYLLQKPQGIDPAIKSNVLILIKYIIINIL